MTDPNQVVRLVLAEVHQKAIRSHALACYPEECCGLLSGEIVDGHRKVLAVRPSRNAQVDSRETRYRIAPEDFLKGEREADACGWKLLGLYHSHPDGQAIPSEHDLETAWPILSYLIIGLDRDGAGAIRSWHLAEDRSRFEPDVIEMEASCPSGS